MKGTVTGVPPPSICRLPNTECPLAKVPAVSERMVQRIV